MNVKSIAGQLGERRARFAISSGTAHPLADHWSVSDFVALTKPRVMMLAVFTALVGLSRARIRLDPLTTLAAVLAIAVGAGAAGVLNMWYDADIDAIMSRTAMRPIPRGRVSRFKALVFGLFLGGFAVVVLALATNLTAAALLAGSILLYVAVYTAWLKRTTRQNIVIGGAAGDRMGRSNRRRRARAACAVLHYLPLDPATFLGSRAQSYRRLCARRRADVAGCRWTACNNAPDPDL
jgi:protoheme IX farnesyltransferase